MAVTKQDWESFAAKKQQDAKLDNLSKLALVQSAALSAEALMGNDQWDQYRQKLEALAQAAEAEAAGHLQKMAWSIQQDELKACQLFYHQTTARAKALREAIQLPMLLVEGYQAVKN
jgi:chaperonin GroEL (HSP60 family)